MHFLFSLLVHLLMGLVIFSLSISAPHRVKRIDPEEKLWIQLEKHEAPRNALARSKTLSQSSSRTRPQGNLPAPPQNVNLDLEFDPSSSEDLSNTSNKNAQETYFAGVRNQIDSFITYPPSLRRRKIHGEVRLKLVLMTTGEIESLAITQSSGYAELDTLALEGVSSAAPFPPFDPILKKMGKLQLNLPIRFHLLPN